jgi:phage gp29-like protein
MIKEIKAALSKVVKRGLDSMQAGARSTQSNALNYASVNTLDPSRLAGAFAAADQGFITEQAALFELVEEQDAHIFAELGKRRRAVTGLGWQLNPLEDASQSEIDRTKELADMLRSIPRFEDAQYDMTDAVGKGFAALEIDWKPGSTWLPQALDWVPQRMFQIERDTGAMQYLKMGLPEPLREWGWVVHEHRAKSGYIEQAALFRVLAWTYAYKAYNIRDMQRFLELYGLPLRLGKYPAGIGNKERDELLRAVRNIGNDGAGVVPSTMSIEFVQASKAGTVDDFLNSVTYWERKQSMAILGGTLTSQADGKSSTNALGLVHDKVRREIMLHDVRQIEPTMNGQIVRPVALINGMFAEDRLPRFGYQTEETVDQAKMVDVLDKAAGVGMEIDVDWAHKTMQIPKAKHGAKLLVSSGKSSAAIKPADAALVRLAALASAGKKTAEGDITGAYAAQLAALCVPHEQDLIQQIAAIVAEAGDYDEALAGMEALKAENPKWAESLGLGMAAANLAGRADAGGE